MAITLLFMFPGAVNAGTGDGKNWNDKGIIAPRAEEEERNISLPARINGKADFSGVKSSGPLIFLVGNDDYSEDSGYAPLEQCYNDVLLLEALFSRCCGVPENNIITAVNLTARDFRERFEEITGSLDKKQSFLFAFSGHGTREGALVFTDGTVIGPDDFKQMINSFPNDTVLMLDACYSGNNEGPLESPGGRFLYKENCIRIYGALAHMQAKEILYDNDYFAFIKPFYENVLAIDAGEIPEGNGYFTSLIGYFFAEYDFSSRENISFQDLINYVSNKSKQYVEFLALRGSSYHREESLIRLNQLPKIFPMNKKPPFRDPNHNFLLLFDPIEPPLGIETELSLGPLITFTDKFLDKLSVDFSLRFAFDPGLPGGLSFGLQTGYYYILRPEIPGENLRQYWGNIIPLLGSLGFRGNFPFSGENLIYRINGGAGIAFCIFSFDEFGSIPTEIEQSAVFCFTGGIGVGYEVTENVFIAFDLQTTGIIINSAYLIQGIKVPISFNYHF